MLDTNILWSGYSENFYAVRFRLHRLLIIIIIQALKFGHQASDLLPSKFYKNSTEIVQMVVLKATCLFHLAKFPNRVIGQGVRGYVAATQATIPTQHCLI
jgi:hypothetical protein